jgi:hypothetical protein
MMTGGGGNPCVPENRCIVEDRRGVYRISVLSTTSRAVVNVGAAEGPVRFAKAVFWIAGIWGLLVLVPLYFLYDYIGRKSPAALTHPEFYYGFVGVALVWQIAFFVIASDPVRFRPIMMVAALEKASYVLTLGVLFLERRIVAAQLTIGVPDAILGVLFAIAFWKVSRGISGSCVSGMNV